MFNTLSRTVGILLAAGAFGQTGRPSSPLLRDYSQAVEQVAAAANLSVVQILVTTRGLLSSQDARRAGFVADQQGTGSGVIVDKDGYIVTNAHVVSGARSIEVTVPGTGGADPKTHSAKIIGLDREIDLAVLKIEATGLPTLSFRDSDQLRQGQFVLALGSPLGLENSLTVGIVSATKRYLKPEDPTVYIQTDAPINPGNSGGPLLDAEAHIVGINTLIYSQSGGNEGIGFAIPSNLVKKVYEQLRKDGRIRRGAIGVIPETITPVMAKGLGLEQTTGVILSDVMPSGAAEAAGLQAGDIVVAVDGHPIRQSRELSAALVQHLAGEEVSLDIVRGSQKIRQKVAIMERPNEPGRLEDLAVQDAQLIRRLGVLAVPVDEKVNAIMPGLRKLTGVAVAAIPAEFAGRNPGLAQGDIIYSINNKRVETVKTLIDELYSRPLGSPIVLHVERRGQLIYVAFEME